MNHQLNLVISCTQDVNKSTVLQQQNSKESKYSCEFKFGRTLLVSQRPQKNMGSQSVCLGVFYLERYAYNLFW